MGTSLRTVQVNELADRDLRLKATRLRAAPRAFQVAVPAAADRELRRPRRPLEGFCRGRSPAIPGRTINPSPPQPGGVARGAWVHSPMAHA